MRRRPRTDSPPPTSATADPGGLRKMFSGRLGRWSIRSAQIIVVLVLATAAVYALVQLRVLVIPLLIATILAAAATPLIARLRRVMPPILAAWIVLLGVVVVLGGIVTGIVLAVRNQWEEIVDSATRGYEELQNWLSTLPLPLGEIDWTAVRDQVVDFVTSAQFGTGALAGVSAAIELLTGAVLVVVILFFFLKDGDRIWAFFLKPFDAARRARGERIGRTAVRVLGGYTRGTIIIAAIDGVAVGITMLILGVPVAIPLAALVFLGAFVPIVGATVTGVLAALVALVTNGLAAAIIIGIVIIVVNQVEGDVLQPLIMSQSLRLHPLVILVALTAGTLLGGIAGAVLAVPVAAVTWSVLKVWEEPDDVVIPDRRRGRSVRRRRDADVETAG